jgi:thymidylate synthase (FAD)
MINIILLEHTPNPDRLIARAAAQCYEENFVGSLHYAKSAIKGEKLINKVIEMGHTSVLEHASFTFAIEGISRSLSHQLVRFRHASFSQQSQRYVAFKENELFEYITPVSIAKIAMLEAEYEEVMNTCKRFYDMAIRMKVPAEDARFVLPNATETKIVMTMNAREIYHACNLRECAHAQWEIRELFTIINRLVKEKAPVTFNKLGPSCVTKGFCSEGPRCCGRINNP